MRRVWALAAVAAWSVGLAEAAVVVVEGGRSDYQIVLPPSPIPAERYAAEELQRFVEQMTGVRLPVVPAEAPSAEAEILLGRHPRLAELGVRIDWDRLGEEGFTLRTVGRRIVVAGGRPRGTLYGVYELLEVEWGCRWFTPTVSRIPKRDRLVLPVLDRTVVPVLEYREPFWTEAFDGDWAARNRQNGHAARLTEKHGGKVLYGPFVHTFYRIIPPEKYFDAHPEYFALRNGRRVWKRAQLCLTNPDVVRLTIEWVRNVIRSNPDVKIISVSQNDWHGWCECPKCKAIDDAQGSHAGSLIAFVNQVADAIAKDYPHVAIDTLAYQYTRRPPRDLRPRPNVIVRLCSIECCFAHPLATCAYGQNRSFREDIQGWARLTKRLYVWDYTTDFAHYLMPFPNFDVLAPNIRFFVANGVRGIFEQGNYSPGGHGEFAALRAYVLAKLLWNPQYDPQVAINEFITGVYGKAAKPIRAYFDLLHEASRKSGHHLRIYDPPTVPYLTDTFLREADKLFDEAERLADDPAVLRRVQVARLPVQYVQLRRWLAGGEVSRGPQMARRFIEVAERERITHIREGRPMSQFLDELRARLNR